MAHHVIPHISTEAEEDYSVLKRDDVFNVH